MKNLRCIMLSLVIGLSTLSAFSLNASNNVSKTVNNESTIKKVAKGTAKKIVGAGSIALSVFSIIMAHKVYKNHNSITNRGINLFCKTLDEGDDILYFKDIEYMSKLTGLGSFSAITFLLGSKLLLS